MTGPRVRTGAIARLAVPLLAILVAQLAAAVSGASQAPRPAPATTQAPQGTAPAAPAPPPPVAPPPLGDVEGARPLSMPEAGLYADERPPTLAAGIETALRRKVLPALPGAILLLFFSLLFGSINFYGDLPEEQRSLRHTWRYLVVWVFFNYTFSMITLLLILPDNVAMTSVTKTLAVYCIAVAALPELGANLRLQLGRSDSRALDLYKYKTKVSSLITGRMQRATLRDLGRTREALENCYADDPQSLAAQLVAFVQQAELRDDERTHYLAALEAAPKTARALLDAVGTGPAEVERVLDHFGDDISRFRRLPACTLLGDLDPQITVREAQQLVSLGITTRRRFIWRTRFGRQRKRVARATGMTEDRLRLLHFSSLAVARRRVLVILGRVGLVLAMAAVLLVVIGFQTSRTFVTYDPRGYDPTLVDTGVTPTGSETAPGTPQGGSRP